MSPEESGETTILDWNATDDHGHFLTLHSFLEASIADGAFPGAAWGVLHRGRVRALGAAGGFTYRPESRRVTPSTIYDLASVSKVVATTAAAMLLYQRGQLALDMPLGDLLPGFVVAAECGARRHLVTLRLLLAHASGLPGHAPLFLDHPTPFGLLRACLQMPLIATPGSRAEYSDIGFILLGKALELIAGEPLDSFCAREIFMPLGMANTCYRPAQRATIPPSENDQVFRHRFIQGEVHDENCWALGGCAGHAGVFGPAGDLLRFAESMLAPLRTLPPDHASAGGQPASPAAPTLFAPATVRLFTARADLPPASSRALGWDTPSAPSSSGQFFSPRSFGHLGFTGTSLWIDPERDLAAVLLTNRTWPTRENRQIQSIRPAFHDLVIDLL